MLSLLTAYNTREVLTFYKWREIDKNYNVIVSCGNKIPNVILSINQSSFVSSLQSDGGYHIFKLIWEVFDRCTKRDWSHTSCDVVKENTYKNEELFSVKQISCEVVATYSFGELKIFVNLFVKENKKKGKYIVISKSCICLQVLIT